MSLPLYSAAPNRQMVAEPAAYAAASSSRADSRWSVGSMYALGLSALALVYVPVLIGLAHDWATDPNYSHGFLIPFAVAFLVWRGREAWRVLPLRPSVWGGVLAVASQAIYLAGFLGAEYFLQRTSLLLLLAAGIIFLYGWGHLRIHLFSFALLLLAIPLPALLFNAVALPLQLLASNWAAWLLGLCSIPVLREGNILMLPQRTLDVAEACSGIRSLFSLIALAMMLAYLLPARFWLRLAVVVSAVPIALAANAFRIAATGLLGQWLGAAASEGFFHAFSGWVIFVLAFAALAAETSLLHRWLEARARSRRRPSSALA
ncbi:MAG TPA: exosortase [Terriglobales bacterium]|nr:exosortase [Terriglobales bacterium]